MKNKLAICLAIITFICIGCNGDAIPITPLPPTLPASTPTVQPTVTPKKELYLNTQRPSIDEFRTYLNTFTLAHYYYDLNQVENCHKKEDSLPNLLVSACGLASNFMFYHPGYNGPGSTSLFPDEYLKVFPQYETSALKLFYMDINGDSLDDLIVTNNYNFITVLLWLGHHYGTPFTVLHYPWRGNQARFYFDDWTEDGIPEVIFDFRGWLSGTGIFGNSWLRYAIQCHDSTCQLIWYGTIAAEKDEWNTNGKTLLEAQPQLKRNEQNQLSLEQTFKYFEISPFNGEKGTYLVYTTTHTSYHWTGKAFELAAEQIEKRPYEGVHQAILTATNQAGIMASITTSFNQHTTIGVHDICELYVNKNQVGKSFGCASNFITIEWRDITNDNQPEIVILTLSGWYIEDEDGNLLAEEPCFNQHLFAYQWDGQNAQEIANVIGCVVQPDLYGVKFKDMDNDGQPEILAAVEWVTKSENSAVTWFGPTYFDNVYKWNGKQFILSAKTLRTGF